MPKTVNAAAKAIQYGLEDYATSLRSH